jgi:acylphosphatase
MQRLIAYVSGKVQETGYMARVVDIAKVLGLRGTVENLDDGRVRIIAEGPEDKLGWFEEAIDIKNTLIQVSSIERERSPAIGEFAKFYKLVEPGETDSRLDTAAAHLKDLVSAVNKLNDNLGSKMDLMVKGQEGLGSKIDAMNDNLGGKMDLMIQKQDDLLDEVKESRKGLKGYLDQRFEKLEGDVTEMKIALKAKGII